jgi:hypothetical protein
MKKELIILMLFLAGIFSLNFISADSYQDGLLTVSVDILKPYALIEISPVEFIIIRN